MVKFFGFMVAVAALVSSANAALLSSYEYPNNNDKAPTFTAGGVASGESSTGTFSSTGGVAAGTMSSSTASTTRNVDEKFFITAATSPNYLLIDSLTFDGSVASGTRTVTWSALFNLGTPVFDTAADPSDPDRAFGIAVSPPDNGFQQGSSVTGTISNVGNSYTVTFATPVKVDWNKILRATVRASGVGTGATTVNLDNVKFHGAVVPEPSSIAVFGLLGAGAVIRRIRRKS